MRFFFGNGLRICIMEVLKALVAGCPSLISSGLRGLTAFLCFLIFITQHLLFIMKSNRINKDNSAVIGYHISPPA